MRVWSRNGGVVVGGNYRLLIGNEITSRANTPIFICLRGRGDYQISDFQISVDVVSPFDCSQAVRLVGFGSSRTPNTDRYPHSQLSTLSLLSPSPPTLSTPPPTSSNQSTMKITGLLVLSCMVVLSDFTAAFVAPPCSPQPLLKSRVSCRNTGAVGATRQGKSTKEPDVTVFDAGETPVSWEEYKNQKKPDEYKV